MTTPYDVIASNSAAFEKFCSKCSAPNEEGCILWHRAEAEGYGRFYFGNRRYPAHRMAWVFKNGEIPKGLFVCHACDVRLCVNPDHLFLGTNKDNIDDMIRKGRNGPSLEALRRSRAWPRLFGMNAPSSILTESQVIEIFRRHHSAGESCMSLAIEFGVGRSTIWQIVTGKNWRHLGLRGEVTTS
jgi:hypothetical protein